MLFSVILLSLVLNFPLDGQQLDTDTIRPRPLLLSCSGSIYICIQLLRLRHCVPSLLRFRVRNSGVQDNVYVIVPNFL